MNKYVVESNKIINRADRIDLLGTTLHDWTGVGLHADIFDTGSRSNISDVVCTNGHIVPPTTTSRITSWGTEFAGTGFRRVVYAYLLNTLTNPDGDRNITVGALEGGGGRLGTTSFLWPSSAVLAGALRRTLPEEITQQQYDNARFVAYMDLFSHSRVVSRFLEAWADGVGHSSRNILTKATTKETWISLPYPLGARQIELVQSNCSARLFMTARAGLVLRVRDIAAGARVQIKAPNKTPITLNLYKGTAPGVTGLTTGVDISTLQRTVNGITRAGWALLALAPVQQGQKDPLACTVQTETTTEEYLVTRPPGGVNNVTTSRNPVLADNMVIQPMRLLLTAAARQPRAVRSTFYWLGTQNKTEVNIYKEFELNELTAVVRDSQHKTARVMVDLPHFAGAAGAWPDIALVSNTAGTPGGAFDDARGDVYRLQYGQPHTHIAASSTTGAQPVSRLGAELQSDSHALLDITAFANRYVSTDRDGIVKFRYTLTPNGLGDKLTANITVRVKVSGGTADPAPCDLSFQYSSPSDYNLDYNQNSFAGPKVNPCPTAHNITYSVATGPATLSFPEGHTNGSGNPDYNVVTTLGVDETTVVTIRATDNENRTKDITLNVAKLGIKCNAPYIANADKTACVCPAIPEGRELVPGTHTCETRPVLTELRWKNPKFNDPDYVQHFPVPIQLGEQTFYFDVATEGCAGTVTYAARRDGSRHNLIQHISGTVAEVDISIAEDEVIPIVVSATCDGHTITRNLRFRHREPECPDGKLFDRGPRQLRVRSLRRMAGCTRSNRTAGQTVARCRSQIDWRGAEAYPTALPLSTISLMRPR